MSVVADDVLELTKHGLYPVRLHYPIFRAGNTYCSCGSPTCKTQGKHPVGNSWGKSATQDADIITEQWTGDRWNVGIIMGICHGIPADKAIIDIEDDSPEGRELADVLFQDVPSPMYSSGKGIHRIFRWTEDLPNLGNFTITGLEFRFGGKGIQTQSVAPPSMHPNGKQYQWLPGHSLDDIPITPLPPHVMEFLLDEYARRGHSAPGTTSSTNARLFRSPGGKLTPGARHHSLLVECNRLWRLAYTIWGINGIEEQEAIDQVWMWIWGANITVCDPPKTEAEIQVIFRSSQAFMMKEFLAEIEENLAKRQEQIDPQPPADASDRSFGAWLHSTGIRLINDPTIHPTEESPERIDEWGCNWKLRIVTKGDEELVEVSMPGNDCGDCDTGSHPGWSVTMRHEEFEKAGSFARRVQTDTGGAVILNRTFAWWNWTQIWAGRANDAKHKKGITRGLREYLMTAASVLEKKENSLEDQVEDLIAAMSGNLSKLVDALQAWKSFGHQFSGRLKIIPGGNDLTSLRIPEDPLTGYYFCSEEFADERGVDKENGVDGTPLKILHLVKMDEINRRYRQSFGSGISSRKIVESLESLGFSSKRWRKGTLEGRWFAKEIKIENIS